MIRVILTILIVFFSYLNFAQPIGIGTSQPNPNAVLDVYSPNKALLIPRMDSTSRNAITASKGMIVFDTSTGCLWQHNGVQWVNSLPASNTPGSLAYWNGNSWNALAPGQAGQYLSIQNGTGLPVWSGISFSTENLSTNPVSNINPTTANSGGSIQSDGGSPILERGIVWSTTRNPTVALTTKTSDGSGVGNFSSSMTGLSSTSTYYVRAYARNANGVSYGNEVSFLTGGNFSIGQTYGGGKIFYIDATGQHGLIVSPEDLTTTIHYDTDGSTSTGSTTNATGLAIGTGSNNTNTLLSSYGSTRFHAASYCKLFYNGGGYTDWYLPSLMELQQLYFQRNAVGVPSLRYYWSSSEVNAFNAWVIDFGQPTFISTSYNKSTSAALRAIRAF